MTDTKPMAEQIANYILDPHQKMLALIDPSRLTRFVVCGQSGSGKTLAIEEANKVLPEDEQIADVNECYYEKDLSKILKTVGDHELKPERGRHIAFRMMDPDHAAAVEQKIGLKVFWFD